ncbi:uncharacterized protein LOC105229976 [Bactrocera dorsalis]|uniref:Uncharacterized protein LOC105229976 n=1 Tax=Bactrocera dorsalis TaxID=27457 RepID=A0A6I9V924_BACDO|nr:uncharacterized protein LOC105229976 [Bactrocera dorsalis]
MFGRNNNNHNNNNVHLQIWLLCFIALIINSNTSMALPIRPDSPIQTIIVPYQRHTVSGHPYQYPKLTGEKRQVLVPAVMEVVPRFNLNQGEMAMGSQKGMPVNFVDGAYPVYYMPSNVNGKFNGQISLLEGVVQE